MAIKARLETQWSYPNYLAWFCKASLIKPGKRFRALQPCLRTQGATSASHNGESSKKLITIWTSPVGPKVSITNILSTKALPAFLTLSICRLNWRCKKRHQPTHVYYKSLPTQFSQAVESMAMFLRSMSTYAFLFFFCFLVVAVLSYGDEWTPTSCPCSCFTQAGWSLHAIQAHATWLQNFFQTAKK